jgi:hypothetical protein
MSSLFDFPSYSFADELKSPRELGIKRDGSFGGISRAVAGINYYTDSIGFGTETGMAKLAGLKQKPLGIRFFVNTGSTCSNGADMHEYIDLIPHGSFLGKRVTDELKAMKMPLMRGMSPGMMEDSISALNPIPLIKAASGSGYAKCKKVTHPVGDIEGKLKSRWDTNQVWVKDPVNLIKGVPHQTRWVFDKWISMEEFDSEPKTVKGTNESILFNAAALSAAVGAAPAAALPGAADAAPAAALPGAVKEGFTDFLPVETYEIAGAALILLLAFSVITHVRSNK